MKANICPTCGVTLERYHYDSEPDVAGGIYPASSGWACPKGCYDAPDAPWGSCLVLVLLVVLVALAAQ